jgi:N-acetylglucosaminyl-diphospho-decaprenol L-rhamnosyltransferase
VEVAASNTQAGVVDTGAVVVTHRRADLARACVERLLHELSPTAVAVVVNDPEASPEPDLAWLRRTVGSVVTSERPRGYGANLNEGVRQLGKGFRYWLLLNDDVLLEPGSIELLRDALESDSRAGVAGPRLVDAAGRPQQTAHRYPSFASEVASALIVPGRLQRWVWGRFVLSADPSEAWLVGAALLVRASAFAEVDGFDEQFFLYSEETDLCARLRERGWGTRTCEKAVGVHLGAESTFNHRYRRLMGSSRGIYIRKHWGRGERLALGIVLPLVHGWNAIYVACRILLAPRSSRDKLAFWRLHWDKRPQ